MTLDVIHFYRPTDPWGELSNFAPYPLLIDAVEWPTSEHLFQASKFADTPYAEEIRRAPNPMEAARLGRDHTRGMRRDWYGVRDAVMKKALLAKFTQHGDLRALLLSTGDALLVEHTKNDRYWGDGGDGSGRNRLGLLLMEVREQLRVAAS
ncbi:NADAR family protein [Tenggerimyces flavus]|uniref:NADAR family protein n=1 Tax=Tenggerimyces flavus TaxID=1708749 RepID=A0ABV7YA12_9ACTN|nr:NADAR family protein [Tenggerimyces flavus]MBM7783738.1 ribA/ribD-fused uncharacterized protein [Tenggerimyces flavus]